MAVRRAAEILERLNTALLPVATDAGAVALATSQRFGPFNTGDALVIASTAAFHALAGDGTVVATTARPVIPSGVYKFVMPDGCTHVAMIDSSSGAGSGQAYLG